MKYFLVALICVLSLHCSAKLHFHQLNYRHAAEVIDLIKGHLNSDEKISGEGFQLIINSSEERYQALQSLIEQIDKKPAEFIIQVKKHLLKRQKNTHQSINIHVNPEGVQGQVTHYSTRNQSNKLTTQTIRTLANKKTYIYTGKMIPIGFQVINPDGSRIKGTHYKNIIDGFHADARLNSHNQVLFTIHNQSQNLMKEVNTLVKNQVIQRNEVGTQLLLSLDQWVIIGESQTQSKRQSIGTRDRAAENYQILLKVSLVGAE